MNLEKKIRSYVYGIGRIFDPIRNRHSKAVAKRLKRTQKRGARAKVERIEKNDDAFDTGDTSPIGGDVSEYRLLARNRPS